ncbi:PREDICTED: uncharacterized protein LOC106803013 isoform X3 [Ceratotherium simum simum]|uniref:Uncharacterized protein LOC106803013 isoform X3 n=1 Tax=Ceratotherium simum simum TaxID=73337 RepID=A0ABM1D9N1_CERSS|nr:PREDICTED: uncharacterized protein LOC106803013 isoform X3 [Ceratotherium simum simum]
MDWGRGQGVISVEKGVPFGFPLCGMRERRGKRHRAARGRDKARGQGAQGQAGVRGRSQLEPGSRGVQRLREKLWMPWNGLIVIGKRMELLGRNTQKPRMWDPKLGSESWRLEDVEKTVSKGKSGRSQERMDVNLLHSVASALQASAGLGKGSPKEIRGKQEVRRKIGAESETAGTTAGSRKGSGFKESLRFTGVGTGGEDLRSRGYKLRQNEEERRSSGEKLRSSGEKLSGEKLRSSGEKLGTSGEDLRSTGDKLQSSAEKLGSSREKLGTSGESLEGSRTGSINEEKIERVVEVSGDERLIEVTDAVMEIPFEGVEGNDEELEGAEKAVEDVLGGVNDIIDESVSMEEKEVIDEEPGE